MAFKYADRVQETTTTTGTGTITLAGALTDYRTFASALSVGDTCAYCIEDTTNHTWEVGIGALATSTTLTRTTVLSSTNAGALVTFGAGTKNVYITWPAVTLVGATNSPMAVAPIDTIQLFNRQVGMRNMLAINGPSGLDTPLQPHIARNSYVQWQPQGGSTTIVAVGAGPLTVTGTATAAGWSAAGSLQQNLRRLDHLVTVAATTAVAGWRYASALWTVGGATLAGSSVPTGGFHFICRWGPATGVATTTNRAFVGMANVTTAPTDVEPSTQTNMVGMGWNAADTNIQIMFNAASTATKIDLGASFPVPTTDSSKAYELALFSPPGTTQSVGYSVTDLATGAVASGTITTNLPSTTTALAPRGWMSVGGTSSVIGITLNTLYIETDY